MSKANGSKASNDEAAMDELIQNNQRFQSLENDAVRLLNIYTKLNIPIQEKEEATDMCKAWDDHKQSGIKEGRIIGEREGRIAGERDGRIIGERDGRIAGLLESLYELLEGYPDNMTTELRQQLSAKNDPAELKQVFRLALNCHSCLEFEQKLAMPS